MEKIKNNLSAVTCHLPVKDESPLVSVIITTKNEEKNIENCLKSIQKQTYEHLEIIVVDNFSTDNTIKIAEKYAKVLLKGNERSTQRNYGAEVANGNYIMYLDADMILSPDVIEECVKNSQRSGVDAFYIPERIVGDGFWINVRDFERSFYTGTVIDAVRFIRKALFIKVGGFDENLVGPEDWDFDRRIKKAGTVGVIDAPLYHNEGTFSIIRYLKKKKYYTKTFDNYIQKWGKDDPQIKKQLGMQYRLAGVFFENGKWKKLVKNPVKTIGMFFLRVMVGIVFLRSR